MARPPDARVDDADALVLLWRLTPAMRSAMKHACTPGFRLTTGWSTVRSLEARGLLSWHRVGICATSMDGFARRRKRYLLGFSPSGMRIHAALNGIPMPKEAP